MDSFSDLAFFALLAKQPSLAAAAQQLGVTPPAVSKRLAFLEKRLGVRLLNRTTRRLSLTPEGETYLVDGTKLLADLDALERTVAGSGAVPMGVLRMSATLGFGRRFIACDIARRAVGIKKASVGDFECWFFFAHKCNDKISLSLILRSNQRC